MTEKPSENPSIWQPFTDIVGGQRDEGYVNLSNDISKKISIPSNVKGNEFLQYNASTGRYETVTLNTIMAYQRVAQSADVTITATTLGTAQALTGATITATVPGVYRIQGVFDMDWTVASAGTASLGALYLNGASASGGGGEQAILTCLATATRVTITESWSLTLAAGDVVDLRGYKTAAAGTNIMRGSASGAAHGSIEILRVGF